MSLSSSMRLDPRSIIDFATWWLKPVNKALYVKFRKKLISELMREYNDEERRKYEENEHKSRMQKKERKELLEQLLAAGSTDTELIKDTKKRLETITKEQEEGRTKRTAFWQQLKKVS